MLPCQSLLPKVLRLRLLKEWRAVFLYRSTSGPAPRASRIGTSLKAPPTASPRPLAQRQRQLGANRSAPAASRGDPDIRLQPASLQAERNAPTHSSFRPSVLSAFGREPKTDLTQIRQHVSDRARRVTALRQPPQCPSTCSRRRQHSFSHPTLLFAFFIGARLLPQAGTPARTMPKRCGSRLRGSEAPSAALAGCRDCLGTTSSARRILSRPGRRCHQCGERGSRRQGLRA